MKIITLTGKSEDSCNSYLVIGEKNVLIDAGDIEIKNIKRKIKTLDTLLLTHSHPDHIKKLEEVLESFEPEFYAFEYSEANKLNDKDTVIVGDKKFKVLHTPGHAPDHIVFLGKNTLFSGDIVVYNDSAFTNGSFGRTDIEGADREELIKSIQKLLEKTKGVEKIYPGHGKIYKGDIRSVIKRALHRAKMREPKYS